MNQATIVYADQDHAVAVLGNLIISYSRAEPSREYLQHWIDHAKRTVAAHRQLAAITIVDSDAKPPSDQVRVEINETLRTMGADMAGIAYVLEGKGFVAAAKRSAVAMIALLARFPFPMRAFGDVAEAAVWLSSQPNNGPEKLTPRVIVAAAESARAALKSR